MAWPVLALCSLTYLGSVLHFVLVQHRTCLEHGEMVHGGAGEDASLIHAVDAEGFDDSRIARAVGALWVEGTDAHCPQSFLRRVTPPPPHSVLAVALASSTEVAPLPSLMGAEPVARLRLAPKSSPPQA